MNADYTIRPAQRSDLDRLAALQLALQDHLEASNPDLWRMSDQTRAQLKGQLAARLAAPEGCVLVAEHAEDGVVGVIYGRVVTNKGYVPSRTGMVDQAFVQPQHRRRGVGARLVAETVPLSLPRKVWMTSPFATSPATNRQPPSGQPLGFTPRIVTVGASRQVVEVCLGHAHSEGIVVELRS